MNLKKKIKQYILFTFLVTLLFPFFSFSQTKKILPPPLTRILFIYDASNSMNGKWQSGNKDAIAKKLLTDALDSLSSIQNLEIALRAYGHQKKFPPQDCDDTRLEVPFSKNNTGVIKEKLRRIIPKGTTPIAATLEASGNDFPNCSNCRNIIILITDGIEECNGDPCAVSAMLQKKGIYLKPFVIGIGLDMNFKKTFECIGNYFDASDEKSFKLALGIVISQALNSTTSQINLLNTNGKPTESDVNMTFYDNYTQRIQYNYVHTLNHRGNPDTIMLDPALKYDLVVHTIPPVKKENITITPGIHNIVAVDAGQGELQLVIQPTSPLRSVPVLIKKDDQIVNVQKMGERIKYLNGTYNLQILCLPRVTIKDVLISQSHTTKIEIPEPGIVTLNFNTQGYGSIYLEKNGKLEWIVNLTENDTKESFTLQPGNYRAVFRAKSAKESVFTTEKSFKITSGTSVSIQLF